MMTTNNNSWSLKARLMPRWISCWTALAVFLGTQFNDVCLGQGGVSSMSVGMMRAGMLPSPAEIKVEEFINYHRHVLPVPTDQPLGLDVKRLSHDGKHYLQIGFATPRKIDFDKAPPLNLVLVVDCSGSMASGNRMDRVRRGLSMLMERIRPIDLVSIVTFSDTAEVRLEACKKTDLKKIHQSINSLQPTNSTNLHAGLMLGYRTAKEHFESERSNRVILLTDGIANVGQTTPEQIAKDSKSYNKQGIDLSTIGVGQDFNHELLRELATAGKGAVHFVDDSSDLAKIFIDEFDSLLSPSAKKIKLIIEGLRQRNQPVVFGYEPIQTDGGLELKLENMSSGATQVVLLQFEESHDSKLEITVKFKDAATGKKRTLTQTVDEGYPQGDKGDFRKNLAIAMVAQGVLEAAKRNDNGEDLSKAQKKNLKKAIRSAKELFPQFENDVDFVRVEKIAKQFVD